jgi:hypothetical protein
MHLEKEVKVSNVHRSNDEMNIDGSDEDIGKETRKKTSNVLSTIFGPPYLKSCYWLGITDFDNFIQPFISPKIYRKDLEITFAWLKQGFSFSHLSYYLDCNPITLQ